MASQKKGIELHIDYFSQPSRALVIFCNLQNIEFKSNILNLVNLDHKTKEYKKINPILTIPAMSDYDNNVSFGESHTIMRYLAQKYQKFDLYPQDLLEKYKVDFYLDWHIGNLRALIYPYSRGKYIFPIFDMKPSVDLELIKSRDIAKSLKHFENVFMSNGNYIIGEKLTFADIAAYCELSQFLSVEIDIEVEKKYPKTHKWLKKIQQIPIVQETDRLRDKSMEDKGFMAPKL